jgi:hypothetical protein
MGGINNVGGGGLTAYQGASLDTGSNTQSSPGFKAGTGSLGDTNQAKGGSQVLQNAASTNADGSLKTYSGIDLGFQDHTPDKPGSSVRPTGGAIEVYTTGDDLGKGSGASAGGSKGSAGGSSSEANADGTLKAYNVGNDLSKGFVNLTKEGNGLLSPLQNFVSNIVRLNIGKDKGFSSWGDPHEVTGDGLKFDNQLTGRFIAFKSDEGDLEVQKDQSPDPTGRWPGMTLNHAIGMKVGENRINYDVLKNSFQINGQTLPFKDMSTTLKDGTTVTISGNKLSVTSPRGDVINVTKQDAYLDLSGTISGFRPTDSVQGSLGDFHTGDDQSKDLVTRDGRTVGVAQIADFLNGWRVKPGESLI